MSASTPNRLPGAEWRAIVRKSGTKEFAAAFVSNPVLETSVLNGPCVGVDAIGAFFDATAGGIYDTLAFTQETVDLSRMGRKGLRQGCRRHNDLDSGRNWLDRKRPALSSTAPDFTAVLGRARKTAERKDRSWPI
jgi:hypothetical protein